LSALGIGAMQDSQAIEELSSLMNDIHPDVQRAACLALVAIGTNKALETLGSVLLHGTEDLQRTAAEALANNTSEGHAMLKDAINMNDILVRRAAVYGLGRIDQPWVDEILSRVQVEEEQWVVRNAATEVFHQRQRENPHIPQRLPIPSESPWLIAFAGKRGMGIPASTMPVDTLLSALRIGTDEEKLAALSYLRTIPDEGVFGVLYQAMYGGNIELREAVFQTFWEMAARGVDIPNPMQYGIT